MKTKLFTGLFIGIFMFFTAYAVAQIYVVDAGSGTIVSPSVLNGNVTWVHIPFVEYSTDGDGNVTQYTRHNIIRSDRILGIKGPIKHNTGLVDGDGNSIMEELVTMHTFYNQYPNVYLPDISDGTDWEQNLDWALAIERVVRENPGGVVELVDYLP